MTHPIDVVAAMSAIYSRKTRIGKVSYPNQPILFLPRIRGEKLSHLQRPEWVVFPNIRVWVGWIVWFKTPFQKFTNVLVQCNVGPRFFWFDEFPNFKNTLPSSWMSGLWWTSGFKTSSTESSWTYLYQFPKRSVYQIMSTLTGINKTSYNLQTVSRFRQDINRFSRFFLHHSVSTKNKLTKWPYWFLFFLGVLNKTPHKRLLSTLVKVTLLDTKQNYLQCKVPIEK